MSLQVRRLENLDSLRHRRNDDEQHAGNEPAHEDGLPSRHLGTEILDASRHAREEHNGQELAGNTKDGMVRAGDARDHAVIIRYRGNANTKIAAGASAGGNSGATRRALAATSDWPVDTATY